VNSFENYNNSSEVWTGTNKKEIYYLMGLTIIFSQSGIGANVVVGYYSVPV
jgi:hypothetical protein